MAPLQETSNSPGPSRRHSLNTSTSSLKHNDATTLSTSSGPSGAGGSSKPSALPQRPMPKVAALAHLRRVSLGVAGPGGTSRTVSAQNSSLLAANNLSHTSLGTGAALVVETQRYEEWMKIATDNKITSTNTWNLALIDYFADMSLLRNVDGDSINFQKASCTLDGCVKIWTSRVDSVATETGKLLSGLAEDGRPAEEEGSDDEGDGDGNNDVEKKKRKTSRAATTLADKFDKLRAKTLELEFTVDPLFKKTSADFDEGGAGGILMNHLGCDGRMRVVFDAGDAKLEDGNESEEETEDEKEERRIGQKVDLARLMHKFVPSLTALDEKTLCPSLSTFKFAENATLDLPFLNHNNDDDPVPPPRHVNPAVAEFGSGGDDVWRDNMGGGGGDDDDFGGFGDAGGGGDLGGMDPPDFGAGDGGGGDDFFADLGDDTANLTGSGAGAEIDIDVSLADGLGLDEGLWGGGKGKGKSWAGPEHWKMKKVFVRKAAEEQAASAPKVRKEKVAFSIDFLSPSPLTHKELFAPGTLAVIGGASKKVAASVAGRSSAAAAASAALSATGSMASVGSMMAPGKEEEWVLPVDYGFTGRKLLRLFLKPRTMINIRRKQRRAGGGRGGAAGGDDVWRDNVGGGVGAGGDDDLGGMDMGDFGGGAFDDDLDSPIPFATQFLLAEQDDDLHYPDEDDDDEEDEIQATVGMKPTRVRPERIGHATRATRVDMRKLKDSIWRELEVAVIPVKEASMPAEPRYRPTVPAPSSFDAPDHGDDEPEKPEAFVPVLAGLRASYPSDKMDELSTSFCFICLLHLANEKGLRLQAPSLDEDGEAKDVGGIERLRVLRAEA